MGQVPGVGGGREGGAVVSSGGGAVSWTTSEFADNPDANALRWATMYNMWFTADAPPAALRWDLGHSEAIAGTIVLGAPHDDRMATPCPLS